MSSTVAPVNILLLTNRDSDNVGDQIIEASVISLIKGAMKNLGFGSRDVTITSRAASIISRKYMATRDPELLTTARRLISGADVVVFGGAPLFNYAYQLFYLRTIMTLELAQEYGVPVLFSSIGVEPYDAQDDRSQSLRKALALPVVRQITTRDNIDSVRRYVEGTDVATAHVADPAVYADIVFRPAPDAAPPRPVERSGRRIGLVVTRAGNFSDNGIEFSEADQQAFWLNVIRRLEARGDDYKLFTTGHFADEVFLDGMVRQHGIPAAKAAFTVNTPEELVAQLSACDGVIAYRLHASITSYAYGIPSIGLSWNFKVPAFYDSVGYPHRAVDPQDWNAEHVLARLDQAMADGVEKDAPFLRSVYDTLFAGLRGVFAPDSTREPFTDEQLATKLPRYGSTSPKQYQLKVRRKFRRTYEEYQRMSVQLRPQSPSSGKGLPGILRSLTPGRRRRG